MHHVRAHRSSRHWQGTEGLTQGGVTLFLAIKPEDFRYDSSEQYAGTQGLGQEGGGTLMVGLRHATRVCCGYGAPKPLAVVRVECMYHVGICTLIHVSCLMPVCSLAQLFHCARCGPVRCSTL